MGEEISERHWASSQTLSVRSAVHEALANFVRGSTVIVACSGGPDSLALAAAAAFVGRQRELTVIAVIVDHQLQEGSAEVAQAAATACIEFGIDPVIVAEVTVDGDGGPEAAARQARYEVLEAMATKYEASGILLGHTLDDQAETVLLRLARGSGTRSIASMQPRNGLLVRPLLHIPRAVVHASANDVCAAIGVVPWSDPHNDDPRFTRVRVRAAIEVLEEALGSGFVAGLARSAQLASDDADALDQWSTQEFDALVTFEESSLSVDADTFQLLPRAIRSRVIRRMCIDLGAASDAITLGHVQSVDALISQWRGQGHVSLPARVIARREYGRLTLTAPDSTLNAGDPLAT